VQEYQRILNNHQTFNFNTRQEALVRRDKLLNNYNARYYGFRSALIRYKPPTGPSSVFNRNLNTNMNEARKKNAAASKIQAAFRRHQTRLNELKKAKAKAKAVFWRNSRATTNITKTNMNETRKNIATTKIQAAVRGHQTRRKAAASKIQAAVRGHQTRKKYNLENMKNKESTHGLRALRQAFKKNPEIPIYFIAAHGSICTPNTIYNPNKKMTVGKDQWVVFFTKPGYQQIRIKNNGFYHFMSRTPEDFKSNKNYIKKWILNPLNIPTNIFMSVTDTEVYPPLSIMWDTELSFYIKNSLKAGFHSLNEQIPIKVSRKHLLSDLLKDRGPGIFFVSSCRVSKFRRNAINLHVIRGLTQLNKVTPENNLIAGTANKNTREEYERQLKSVTFPIKPMLRLQLQKEAKKLLKRSNLSNYNRAELQRSSKYSELYLSYLIKRIKTNLGI
jgi:hypothetical protein